MLNRFTGILLALCITGMMGAGTIPKLDSLRKLVNAHKTRDTVLVNLLNDLAYEYRSMKPKDAMTCSEQALELSKELNYKPGLSDSYYSISSIYKDYENYDKALYYGKLSLDIDRSMNDSLRIGLSLFNLGNAYSVSNNYSQAVLYYFQALRYIPAKNERKRSAILTSLGTAFYRQRNMLLAEKYFMEARAISEKYNDTEGIGRANANMGLVYEAQNKMDKALSIYFETVERTKNSDLFTTAAAYSNIAGVYFAKEKYDSCLYFAEKTKEIRISMGDSSGVAEISTNIGSLYASMGKRDLAIQTLEKAATFAKSSRQRSMLQTIYSNLASVYSELKQYDKAYTYERMSVAIKDTLFNTEITKQTADMQGKYDTERKESEIALLSKQKELSASEISRQRMQMAGLLGIVVLLGIVGVLAYRAYKTKQKANLELAGKNNLIESQKSILEEKNKEITDSIMYASRIQKALITSEDYIKSHLPDSFIFYKPKAIVSGDFYWALADGQKRFYLATADCTGHGVPGAFMSLLTISILNEVTIEKKLREPDLILNEARKDIIHALNPKGDEEAKDGMDCCLCLFDFEQMKLHYAAANNAFYIIRDGVVIPCPADKMPVGKSPKEHVPFTRHSLDLKKGDVVYTFSDGYADQFGGEKGKKFKYKQLEDLLIAIHQKPAAEQQQILENALIEWRGNLEQVDDILIIGVKV